LKFGNLDFLGSVPGQEKRSAPAPKDERIEPRAKPWVKAGTMSQAPKGAARTDADFLMRFSDQFETRLAEMLTHYPTKRSVLVPTLLYAQDEVGYLTDEVIAELANRLDLTELEVRNVISYYSMLTTTARGKYNLQVCTNISCMLRGGEEIFHHCKKKLGIGHKGTTVDGLFSLEEVECIGACSWAPAIQVNYEFHENLTAEKMDKVLEDYKKKGTQ
jgi:NADH-quinone oxidoreductase subunit E